MKDHPRVGEPDRASKITHDAENHASSREENNYNHNSVEEETKGTENHNGSKRMKEKKTARKRVEFNFENDATQYNRKSNMDSREVEQHWQHAEDGTDRKYYIQPRKHFGSFPALEKCVVPSPRANVGESSHGRPVGTNFLCSEVLAWDGRPLHDTPGREGNGQLRVSFLDDSLSLDDTQMDEMIFDSDRDWEDDTRAENSATLDGVSTFDDMEHTTVAGYTSRSDWWDGCVTGRDDAGAQGDSVVSEAGDSCRTLNVSTELQEGMSNVIAKKSALDQSVQVGTDMIGPDRLANDKYTTTEVERCSPFGEESPPADGTPSLQGAEVPPSLQDFIQSGGSDNSSATSCLKSKKPEQSVAINSMKFTPSSEMKFTPSSEMKFTPSSEMKFTPSSEVKFTPSSEMKFTPSSEMRFTPGSEMKFTPSSEMKFTPSSEMKFIPSSEMKFTPSSENDYGTFFLSRMFPRNFDVRFIQQGFSSHATLHTTGAFKIKSDIAIDNNQTRGTVVELLYRKSGTTPVAGGALPPWEQQLQPQQVDCQTQEQRTPTTSSNPLEVTVLSNSVNVTLDCTSRNRSRLSSVRFSRRAKEHEKQCHSKTRGDCLDSDSPVRAMGPTATEGFCETSENKCFPEHSVIHDLLRPISFVPRAEDASVFNVSSHKLKPFETTPPLPSPYRDISREFPISCDLKGQPRKVSYASLLSLHPSLISGLSSYYDICSKESLMCESTSAQCDFSSYFSDSTQTFEETDICLGQDVPDNVEGAHEDQGFGNELGASHHLAALKDQSAGNTFGVSTDLSVGKNLTVSYDPLSTSAQIGSYALDQTSASMTRGHHLHPSGGSLLQPSDDQISGGLTARFNTKTAKPAQYQGSSPSRSKLYDDFVSASAQAESRSSFVTVISRSVQKMVEQNQLSENMSPARKSRPTERVKGLNLLNLLKDNRKGVKNETIEKMHDLIHEDKKEAMKMNTFGRKAAQAKRDLADISSENETHVSPGNIVHSPSREMPTMNTPYRDIAADEIKLSKGGTVQDSLKYTADHEQASKMSKDDQELLKGSAGKKDEVMSSTFDGGKTKITTAQDRKSIPLEDYDGRSKVISGYEDKSKISFGYDKRPRISAGLEERAKLMTGYDDKTISSGYDDSKISAGYDDKSKISSGYDDKSKISAGENDRKKISALHDKKGIHAGYDNKSKINEKYEEKSKISAELEERSIIMTGYDEKSKRSEVYAEKSNTASRLEDKSRISAGHEDKSRISSVEDKSRIGAGHEDKSRISAGHEDKSRITAGHEDKSRISSGHADKSRISAGHEDMSKISVGLEERAKLLSGYDYKSKKTRGLEDKSGISLSQEDKSMISSVGDKPGISAGFDDKSKISTPYNISMLSAGEKDKSRIGPGHEDKSRVNEGQEENSIISAQHEDTSKISVGLEERAKLLSGYEDKSKKIRGLEDKSRISLSQEDKSIISSVGDKPGIGTGHEDKSRISSGHEDKSRISSVGDKPGIDAGHENKSRISSVGDKPGISAGHEDKSRISAGHEDKSRSTTGHEDKSRISSGKEDKSRISSVGDKSRIGAGHEDKSKISVGLEERAKFMTGYDDKSKTSSGLEDKSKVSVGHEEKSNMWDDQKDKSLISAGYGDKAKIRERGHDEISKISAGLEERVKIRTGYDDKSKTSSVLDDKSRISAIHVDTSMIRLGKEDKSGISSGQAKSKMIAGYDDKSKISAEYYKSKIISGQEDNSRISSGHEDRSRISEGQQDKKIIGAANEDKMGTREIKQGIPNISAGEEDKSRISEVHDDKSRLRPSQEDKSRLRPSQEDNSRFRSSQEDKSPTRMAHYDTSNISTGSDDEPEVGVGLDQLSKTSSGFDKHSNISAVKNERDVVGEDYAGVSKAEPGFEGKQNVRALKEERAHVTAAQQDVRQMSAPYDDRDANRDKDEVRPWSSVVSGGRSETVTGGKEKIGTGTRDRVESGEAHEDGGHSRQTGKAEMNGGSKDVSEVNAVKRDKAKSDVVNKHEKMVSPYELDQDNVSGRYEGKHVSAVQGDMAEVSEFKEDKSRLGAKNEDKSQIKANEEDKSQLSARKEKKSHIRPKEEEKSQIRSKEEKKSQIRFKEEEKSQIRFKEEEKSQIRHKEEDKSQLRPSEEEKSQISVKKEDKLIIGTKEEGVLKNLALKEDMPGINVREYEAADIESKSKMETVRQQRPVIRDEDEYRLKSKAVEVTKKNADSEFQSMKADGESMKADGQSMKAEGQSLKADGQSMKAEGQSMKADGQSMKADGQSMKAEGQSMKADGQSMKAESQSMKADGQSMKTEGQSMKAEGQSLKAEGQSMKAEGQSMKADGQSMKADDQSIKGKGQSMKAEGQSMKAEGQSIKAEGQSLKAEGQSTKKEGPSMKVEGQSTKEEGQSNQADDHSMKAEGQSTKKEGQSMKAVQDGTPKTKAGREDIPEFTDSFKIPERYDDDVSNISEVNHGPYAVKVETPRDERASEDGVDSMEKTAAGHRDALRDDIREATFVLEEIRRKTPREEREVQKLKRLSVSDQRISVSGKGVLPQNKVVGTQGSVPGGENADRQRGVSRDEDDGAPSDVTYAKKKVVQRGVLLGRRGGGSTTGQGQGGRMSGAWTKRVMDFLQKTKDGRQSDAMMSERLSLTSQQRAVSLGGETNAAIEAFKARQGSRRSDFSESERKAQKNGSLDEKANEQKRRSYGEKTNEQTRRSFDEKTHEQRGRSYGERAIEKREVSQGSSAHTTRAGGDKPNDRGKEGDVMAHGLPGVSPSERKENAQKGVADGYPDKRSVSRDGRADVRAGVPRRACSRVLSTQRGASGTKRGVFSTQKGASREDKMMTRFGSEDTDSPQKSIMRSVLGRKTQAQSKLLVESHYYPRTNLVSVVVKPINIEVNRTTMNVQVHIDRRPPRSTSREPLRSKISFIRRPDAKTISAFHLNKDIIDTRAANPPFNTATRPEADHRYQSVTRYWKIR